MDWLRRHPASRLFTTSVTEAELRFGLELLPDGRRRQTMGAVLDAIFEQDFTDRVLPFDRPAARLYARIAAQRRAAGRPISQADAMIAAIAGSHDAVVATRNIPDFAGCGIALVDPWAPDVGPPT